MLPKFVHFAPALSVFFAKGPNLHFAKSHDQKRKIFVKYFFYTWVFQNFVCFTLAFTISKKLKCFQDIKCWIGTHGQNNILLWNMFFFIKWSWKFVHFALALTISKISVFNTKRSKSALFQSNMNQNYFLCEICCFLLGRSHNSLCSL